MSVALPCVPAGSKLLSISTQGVQPDAVSGFSSPEVSPLWVPVPPCPTSNPKPQSDLVPSRVLSLPPGADAHECDSTQGVQPDAVSGFSSPKVSPLWVPVPPCPASDPKPQSDLVPSGVLSLPPGADAHECEMLAYQAMSQYPPGNLPTEVVYDVLRKRSFLPGPVEPRPMQRTSGSQGDMAMGLW